MKINYLHLSLCLYFIAGLKLSAQLSAPVSANNIDAEFCANGGLFQNQYYWEHFRVKDANRIALGAGSIWIGAKIGGELRTATQNEYALTDTANYSRDGSDFSAGPVADTYSRPYTHRYRRVWKVTKDQVETHQSSRFQPGYTAPEAILNWPGNGDTTNGEARILAPFYDINGNGLYEPRSGDYPLIRGDEAVYMIFKDDNRTDPMNYNSTPLKVEIHLMAYAFDSVSEPALHNSLFLHYKIHNRSGDDLDSMIVSNWTRYKLGNPSDDLFGSDSASGMVYFYNGDLDDESPEGFGQNPPAMGLLNLQQNFSGHIGYHILGPFATHHEVVAPSIPEEYFNYMNQLWRFGDSLGVDNPSGKGNPRNGDGYGASNESQKTSWIFEESYNWYESPDSGSKKRSIFSTKPTNLPAGAHLCLDYAYIYGRDNVPQDILSSVNVVKSYAQQIENFFDAQSFPCMQHVISVNEHETSEDQVQIFPNPVSRELTISFGSPQNQIEVVITDVSGRIMVARNYKQLQQIEIPLNASPGVYWLQVKTADRSFIPIKLIKE